MLETETFETREPKNKLLKKNIAYYYFHSITKPNQLKRIFYYPNPVNALTIYKNSKVYFKETHSLARPSQKNEYDFCYGGIQKYFRVAEMNTPFTRIGIAFKPLGINAFLELPLSDLISKNDDLHFDYFSSNMKPVLEQVNTSNDIEEKVNLLDAYFSRNQHPFLDECLTSAIQLIDESEPIVSVQDLVTQLGVSHKTLHRKFKKHLNCSIKTYIDIVQFRKALNHYLKNENPLSLTALANNFDYYDQAEFINKFKKITGINPKRLFKDITQYGNQELFWNSNH
ncbi:AraC family transcriptional regulator [Subsaxibacter sp. CAU 1640]|uniref:helix-turn-helix domain-containing protein n=1 Tax=Subsaxibacter sp. CAU 1640 TaxID=2933271 RepID=UPI0020058402|nr:AraC family transcriptional regulator [Subsaxibacter sp. CAU 1640]MCK7589180.1 AraC family transcriptional regulator [Subsaxibacter sp. CAU 1640]